MNEHDIARRAIERKRAGKTIPLSAIFGAFTNRENPVKLARHTPTELDLFNLWRGVRSGADTDHTAAGVLADWLAEHDDWREGMARATATQTCPKSGLWSRPDGVNIDFGHPNHLVIGAHGVTPSVWFGRDSQNRPVVGVYHSLLHPTKHDTTGLFSVHTLNEYERLRKEAESAGQKLPKAPRTHEPMGEPAPDMKLSRAREVLTWVGGHVPGGKPAQGFWPGGAEESSVLTVPDAQTALSLAQRNGQKSALWFTPGKGSDALHVIRFNGGYPRSLSRILRKHGVSEFTITSHPVSVHVVDQGAQNGDAVKAAASEAGGSYSRVGGTAGYSERPTKLSREDDQKSFHDAMAKDPNDHVTRSVYADWLREQPEEHLRRAGERLHWWAQVLPHMPTALQSSADAVSKPRMVKLPEWAQQLAIRHWEDGFYGSATAHADERHPNWELYSLGLGDEPVTDFGPKKWVTYMHDRPHENFNRVSHVMAAQRASEKLKLAPPE